MRIGPTSSLGEIVVAEPRSASLFERLGLDYCCGGATTLEEACTRRGLDAATVAAVLDALADERSGSGPHDAHDVAHASIGELCDHILVRHHGPLRPTLDRITHLLATVVRVHGHDHPDLADLERVTATLAAELTAHARIEEETLFPACRGLDESEHAEFDQGLLALLEEEHSATGDALCSMRELAGGFDTRRALCSMHASLLTELRDFELELHQHIHEENNVLFPRVRAAVARTHGDGQARRSP